MILGYLEWSEQLNSYTVNGIIIRQGQRLVAHVPSDSDAYKIRHIRTQIYKTQRGRWYLVGLEDIYSIDNILVNVVQE